MSQDISNKSEFNICLVLAYLRKLYRAHSLSCASERSSSSGSEATGMVAAQRHSPPHDVDTCEHEEEEQVAAVPSCTFH